MKRWLALGAAFALALPAAAHGSGFLVARFGGQEGNPTTEDPSAIYYNPAGLALGHGWRVEVDGVVALRDVTYDRPREAIDHLGAGTPADAVGANSGPAHLSNVVAAPFLAAVSDLGVPNLGVGVGVFVPFGGSATWDKNQTFAGNTTYPGAVDGVQRWAAIEGSIQSIYLTAAGAYHIPAAHVSAGLALNVVQSSVDLVRARDPNGTDDVVTSSGSIQEGRSLLEAAGTTLAMGAGALWNPIPEVTFGLSYQSQPGFGTMSLTGTLTNKFGSAPTDASKVVLEQRLPDVWRWGIRYKSGATQVHLSGDFTRWSVFDKQCLLSATNNHGCHLMPDGSPVPGTMGIVVNNARNWKNTFGVRMGLSQILSKSISINGGWGYDGDAVPDATIDPGLFDMAKINLSAGLVITNVRVGARLGVDVLVDVTQFFYFDRTVAARRRDPMGEPFVQLPTRQPDGAGSYSQSISVLTLGLRGRF